MRNLKRLGVATGLAASLAGCSSLPAQGPYASAIVEEGVRSDNVAPRFLVTDLTPGAAAVVEGYPRPTLVGRFGDRGAAPSTTIGVGDTVDVTVWEAASGGLFSSQSIAGVTAGSHSATIPEQVVSRDGAITVPYAGGLRVAGRTPHQVEAMIVDRLKGKAIEPQAVVTVAKNASAIATVLGEVNAGARVPLSLRGDRVLDVIATAGGIRAPIPELFVALSRGSVTARVPMQALVSHPSENIYVHPNDVVTVVREPQTFTAFGSTGRNALIPFDAIGISLEEAVAKAGGLLDYTADPKGVFLLRPEPVSIARQLDPRFPIPPGATAVNVVYRVDLKDANTYFVARRLAMRNKDMIYVAASPSTEFQKAISLFTGATSPALSVAATGAAL